MKELTISHWTEDFLSSGLQAGRSEFTNRDQNISHTMFWYIFHIELVTGHLHLSRFLHSHRPNKNCLWITSWCPFSLMTSVISYPLLSAHKRTYLCVCNGCALIFCSPLGLITDYKIFHPKASQYDQYRLRMIFPWLGSALHAMTWSQSSSLWISVYITIPISISSHQQICWHIEPFYHFPFTNHCFRSSLVTWLCDPSQGPCRAFSGDKEHRCWELLEQHPWWALWASPACPAPFPNDRWSWKISPAVGWHCHTSFREQWTSPQCKGAESWLRQDFSNNSQRDSSGSAELQEEIISIPLPTGKIIMGRPPVYSSLSDQGAPLLILISVFYISFIEVFISVLSVRPGAVLLPSSSGPIRDFCMSSGACVFPKPAVPLSAPGCRSRNKGSAPTSGHWWSFRASEPLYRSV